MALSPVYWAVHCFTDPGAAQKADGDSEIRNLLPRSLPCSKMNITYASPIFDAAYITRYMSRAVLATLYVYGMG